MLMIYMPKSACKPNSGPKYNLGWWPSI